LPSASSAAAGAKFYEQAELTQARQKVVKSAVVMANELKAEAILVFTRHGSMARYAGWLRPYTRRFTGCAPAIRWRATWR
jgi:pyruvate kinase